jgi:hypothetical protein
MKQKQKNSREAGEKRFDVIVDYLWGRPTEALLKAITGKELAIGESETTSFTERLSLRSAAS